MSAQLLVLMGTDVHPFDRLAGWVQRWLADRGETAPSCLLQHGSSAPLAVPRTPTTPEGGQPPRESVAFLPHHELQVLISEASVVVCHGGPATIVECRRMGRLPIVVPRDPSLGEHVDAHQQRFARMFAASGLIRLCENESDLRAALDRATRSPEAFAVATSHERWRSGDPVPESVRRVGAVVDRLVAARRARAPAPQPARPSVPLRVLFVGGLGRSGSTLLDRMLDQMPEVCAIGEIVHLWERGIRDGERCGCGLPFSRCDFWARVGKEAFDGWDKVDLERVAFLRRRVDRTRHVPQTALPRLPSGMRRHVEEYARFYARVYHAVRTVSGCDVVVDSSKHASLAFVLRWLPDIDLRVLHLVRDSRGVAHSWAKQVRRPEVVDGEDWMAQFGTARAAWQWSGQNAAFDLLARSGTPVLRERYEDLIADPSSVLRRTRSLVGLADDPGALHFVRDGSVQLQSGHSVSGNPMRFTTGVVVLRPDEAWRRELPAADRRVVSALTLPLRLRYGYLRKGR